LASGLFGSISGSAVANVYATGTFTIPLMKRSGFKNEVAGATEAVASSGGAIMPPVMGSTAFLMADFLGVSYGVICKAAIIPAILYYLSLWFMMDLEAFKMGMQKVPREDREAFDYKSFLKQIYMVAPIAVIIVALLAGKSVFRAAFLAIATTIVVGLIHDPKSMTPRNLLRIMDRAGRSSVSIAAPLTCASIVVGTINLTGVGLKLTSVILRLAGDSLPMVLFLTMILTIILGMGLPTPAAYMLVAVFAPSALTSFGIPALTAHMFCFYYAAFSTITPPVAMAAYAGGNLAGASATKTGWTSCRIGIAAYIIPWIFAYSSALLLDGPILLILQSIATALIGIYMLASGVQGIFLEKKLPLVLRVLSLACALCMIISGTLTDVIGILILVVLVVYVRFFAKADKAFA
jgi:TRAP transporter 4TM/12TM fusion protein